MMERKQEEGRINNKKVGKQFEQFFTSGGQSIGVLVVLDYTSIPKYSNEDSGLISFRIDCFDLAVQGSLKNLF